MENKSYKIKRRPSGIDQPIDRNSIITANIEANPARRTLEIVPSADRILEDTKRIIGAQIERLKIKAVQGYSLEAAEVKQLEQYINTLLKIKKDEREEAQQEDIQKRLKSMSEKELLEYATQAFNLSDLDGSKDGK